MMSILQTEVANTIKQYNIQAKELICDPNFADTALFNEKYGFSPDQGANTIIVSSKKVEPIKYAVCIVLASTKLDVNKKVTKLLGVKRASFADAETTRQLTGMEIGGVVAIGIENLPIFIDAEVIKQSEIIMGGGNRSSKIVLDPKELVKLPHIEVADIAASEYDE